MLTFSPFFVWPVWLTAAKERHETQINRCCCSFLQLQYYCTISISSAFEFGALLHYGVFRKYINVIRSQVKENRTYADISNLFRQNFLGKKGYLRLFSSKHGITKMNDVEVDAIIQDCVSEVSSHFIRHECYFIHLKCRWYWIKAACKSIAWVPRLFLTAVNQPGQGEKKSIFLYFDESDEKLKKLEKFLILTFSWELK